MATKNTKVMAETPVTPSKAGFWDTAVGKTTRAAIYLAISAAVASIIAAITNNPDLFGALTPIVNIVLVMAKNALDPKVKTI